MGKTASRPEDAVRDYCGIARQYAEDVVAGVIPAGKWVRLACQRQLDDLARKDWKWHFDTDVASRPCILMERLPHVEGRWKSATIQLAPWQCFFITTIFGWLDAQGLRRFRKALIVVPRKAGKTSICAGLALYLMGFDGEPGSQVVSAATTRDQAKLAWGVAHKQVQRVPELREIFGIKALAHSIVSTDGSFFKPLSRDADSLEGLNVHGAVIDELHAHNNREVFDVINEATGARRQPLIFIISTEGDQSEGVFVDEVAYIQAILSGAHQDESYFGLYYSLDKEDDWTTPAAWRKANPNMGVSLFESDMEARCTQAKQNPASQASFLNKRLNVRTGSSESFFNMLAWTRICKIENMDPEDLVGQPCVMAIDMASKSDLTSKVLLFRARESYGKIKSGHLYVFTTNYVPEAATQPGKPNYDIYRGWIAGNKITVTDGNITDYDHLERDLLMDVKRFKPSNVGIDPNYNAAQFTNNMQKLGIQMADVAHNVQNFTNAMKDLDADIVAGRIHHNGDPVLTWAIGNVQAKTNAKGDVYPIKSREANKIDPAVALIAAKSLQLRVITRQSVYSTGTGLI